jgi:hypothetical protein
MIFYARGNGKTFNSKLIYLKYYLKERGYKTHENAEQQVLYIISNNHYCKLDFETIMEVPHEFLIKEINEVLHKF